MFLRLLAALVLAVVLAGGVLRAVSYFAPGALDWSGAYQVLARERERAEVLDSAARKAYQRLQAKQALGIGLADGRVSLAEAVSGFRALLGDPGHFWEELRDREPGDSDEERLCRHVIDWAANTCWPDLARLAAVRTRLEGEMRSYLALARPAD